VSNLDQNAAQIPFVEGDKSSYSTLNRFIVKNEDLPCMPCSISDSNRLTRLNPFIQHAENLIQPG
jgi:hypothetical protein